MSVKTETLGGRLPLLYPQALSIAQKKSMTAKYDDDSVGRQCSFPEQD